MSNTNLPFDLRTLVDLEAWQNPRFRNEVQRDPKAAVTRLAAQYGITLPEGMEFRTVSDTAKVYNLVISENPVGASADEFGSEVQAYIKSFAASRDRADRGTSARASTTGVQGFCNTAICSAVNPSLCVKKLA